MNDFFARHAEVVSLGSAHVQIVFDAEHDTPDLIKRLSEDVPQIYAVMACLRQTLPVVPHSGVGPIGRFYRIPNHYRSINFLMQEDACAAKAGGGVVVFKGTEPLIPDFQVYFDWMMSAPFRSSMLPLGLHFPLDMKLPPAAMWIEESIAEQSVSSMLQQQYVRRYDRLARVPLPLFVFKLMPEQKQRYEEVIRRRLPTDAWSKIKNKLVDGLGVEVYYYPELPIRVSDLFVGNVRNAFKEALSSDRVDAAVSGWASLFSEMLCLGYMPFAPWHHGMGGCVDPGNACIDGGFNDLLTLVPCEAIPDDILFRRSMLASIQMLGESVAKLYAASLGMKSGVDADAIATASLYLTAKVRDHVQAAERHGHVSDHRVSCYFEEPKTADIVQILRKANRAVGASSQFTSLSGTHKPEANNVEISSTVGG